MRYSIGDGVNLRGREKGLGFVPRRAFIGGFALALSIALPARAALTIPFPDWATVSIQDQDLGGRVHVLQGFGGNITVLATDQGVIMVDSEYPQLAEKIRRKTSELSKGPIRYLIDTHFHWDHVGGSAGFASTGTITISSNETRNHILDMQRSGKALPDQYPPDPLLPPEIAVSGEMDIHLGGEIAEIIHIRHAHTDGDVIVRFVKADVIATGDAFFNGFYPYIDVAHGGSINDAIAFCDDLYALATPRTRIVPGHGEVANREYIKEYRAMLATVRDRVASRIAARQTLEQIIASKPLADLDPKWGGALIKAPDFLEIVYLDLARGKSRSHER
jgi:glyoxylase-like metal-dependent hydrolase (beta-lactamase superfamily II)